nr:hypothetical protein GCM10020241_60080 [Streptoalloteichus tenebrarius]
MDRETALRQRLAVPDAPGVDEAQETLVDAEDRAGARHLLPAESGKVRPDLGAVQRRVEDVAAFTSGHGADEDLGALGGVAGHRGRAFARLVVGVGVDGHQAEAGAGRKNGSGHDGVLL